VTNTEGLVADPTEDQTEISIGEFLRTITVGDEVAIRETHGGLLRFILAKVDNIKKDKGRLYTDKDGYAGHAWHIRTGRSCRYPTGQSHLVEPRSPVRKFIEEQGEYGKHYSRRSAELHGTDTVEGTRALTQLRENTRRALLRRTYRARR
jgi:hypothetical protein